MIRALHILPTAPIYVIRHNSPGGARLHYRILPSGRIAEIGNHDQLDRL